MKTLKTNFIISRSGINPEGLLYDINNSSGTVGQFLGKNSTNKLQWTTAVPGTWDGTANSDLDMNGYNIISPGDALAISCTNGMTLTGDSINLTSVGNSIDLYSPQAISITAGDGVYITATNDPMTLTATNVDMNLTAGTTMTLQSADMILTADNISLTTNDTGISITAADNIALTSTNADISIHSGTGISILTNDGNLTINSGADTLNLYGNDINLGSGAATINLNASDSINLTCPVVTIPSITTTIPGTPGVIYRDASGFLKISI